MGKSNRSQEAQIFELLRRGATISPFEAVAMFDCLRLGARIYDLRRKGWAIKSFINPGKKRYAVYFMTRNSRKRSKSAPQDSI